MPPDMRSLMSMISEDEAAIAPPSPQQEQQPVTATVRPNVSTEFRQKLDEMLNDYRPRTAASKPTTPVETRSPPPTRPVVAETAPPMRRPVSRVESTAPITAPVSRVGAMPANSSSTARTEPAAPITKPASRVESVSPITKPVSRVDVVQPASRPAPRPEPAASPGYAVTRAEVFRQKPELPTIYAEPPASVRQEFSPEMARQLAGINVGPIRNDRASVPANKLEETVVATRATDREGSFFHDAVPTLDMNLYQEWPVESGVLIAELLANIDRPNASKSLEDNTKLH